MTRSSFIRTTVAAVALLVGLVVPGVGTAHEGSTDVHFRDVGRVDVVTERRLDERQYAVRIQSPSLGRPVDVRVLLPAGYDPRDARRYPVLYLFHGTSGRASDWVTNGGVVATTAKLPVITVMPDAGFDGNGGSWFTDWVDQTTPLGPSKWETFHITDVLPWVDANLRTVTGRGGRAIAGLSQGGFGAMTYAARHPELFSSAASFSGAPEIARDPEMAVGANAVISATAVGLNGTQPEAIFGNVVTNRTHWLGHDPASLVTNLRATSLHLWTATGAPGEYDTAPDPGASGIELLTHQSSQRFHEHLVEEGIPSYYKDYTFGTHKWEYWTRDLQEYAPRMMRDFARPKTPKQIDYTSIDKTWTQWGWTVAMKRTAERDFSRLAEADAKGFVIVGYGTATITTPGVYRPGSVKNVTVAGKTQALRVGSDGRLSVTVVVPEPVLAVRVTIR